MKTVTIKGVETELTPEQIKKIEDAKKPSPEQRLIDILNQVTGKLFDGRQVWSIGDQWIFEVEYQNKILWCYCPKFWKIFEEEHQMEFKEIQRLMQTVVCKALNLEGFTPMMDSVPFTFGCVRL